VIATPKPRRLPQFAARDAVAACPLLAENALANNENSKIYPMGFQIKQLDSGSPRRRYVGYVEDALRQPGGWVM